MKGSPVLIGMLPVTGHLAWIRGKIVTWLTINYPRFRHVVFAGPWEAASSG